MAVRKPKATGLPAEVKVLELLEQKPPDPKDLAKLTRFYREWGEAQERSRMADQTATGARGEALAKEARFKGAMEFLAGTQHVEWKYDAQNGISFTVVGPPDDSLMGNTHVAKAAADMARMNVAEMKRERKARKR